MTLSPGGFHVVGAARSSLVSWLVPLSKPPPDSALLVADEPELGELLSELHAVQSRAVVASAIADAGCRDNTASDMFSE
ncbi:hypothetical protein ACQP0C_12525 [Nocardia sp. CA-129566]|uniref:hypothetical protein n=1 Tax=Nocardia sp. CA-129566 TaxID=3239976 RepID=UPI003D97FFE8